MTPGDDGKQRGMLSWLLQRVSGIVLVYALILHLWTVHYVHGGRLTWETIRLRFQEGSWALYYFLFIPAVLYHAFNGIWGIVLDYGPSPLIRRFWALGLWLGGLALLIYGYISLKPFYN